MATGKGSLAVFAPRHYSTLARPAAALVAVLVFVHISGSLRVIDLPMTVPFGLASVLPVEFWIGYVSVLACIAVSMFNPSRRWALFSLLLLSLYQLSLAVFIEQLPQYHKFFSAALGELIASTGRADPSMDFYLHFPGSFYVLATMRIVTGVGPILLVKFETVVLNALVVVLAYLFFSKTLADEGTRLLASALVCSGMYYLSLLLTSSILGYILYFLIMYSALSQNRNAASFGILILISFATLVISHAYTSFLVLAVLGLFSVVYTFARSLKRPVVVPLFRISAPLFAALLLILAAYWVYALQGIMQAAVLQMISIQPLKTVAPLASNTIYKSRYTLSTLPYVIVYGIPFLVFLLLTPAREKREILLWILSILSLVVVSVSGYVQEFLPRTFSYALMPVSLGIARIYELRKRMFTAGLLLAALILSAALHIPAQYGQDSYRMISSSTYNGTRFSLISMPTGSRIDAYTYHYWLAYFIQPEQSPVRTDLHYYILSAQGKNELLYMEGDQSLADLAMSLQSSEWNRVYGAGTYSIWIAR